eukprot:scaffold154780_cov27-Tisochrysis_lutea.AAC.6
MGERPVGNPRTESAVALDRAKARKICDASSNMRHLIWGGRGWVLKVRLNEHSRLTHRTSGDEGHWRAMLSREAYTLLPRATLSRSPPRVYGLLVTHAPRRAAAAE